MISWDTMADEWALEVMRGHMGKMNIIVILLRRFGSYATPRKI
jgi:hypothetical protein